MSRDETWCTDSVQLEQLMSGSAPAPPGVAAKSLRNHGLLDNPCLACGLRNSGAQLRHLAGEDQMTRRQVPRMDGGREVFLKKLRRYPADRALLRFSDGRKARDFWNLVQYVLDRR